MTEVVVAALAFVTVALAEIATSAERRHRLLERLGRSGHPRAPLRIPASKVVVSCCLIAAWFLGDRIAGIAGSIAATMGVAAAPSLVRRRRTKRRARVIEEQLPEAIAVIASGMRSGRALLQALELAAAEVDAPLGPSFQRLVDRANLGDQVDEAIGGWASEIDSPDARLAAGVLSLHRRTGGALATTLEQLATTLRARRSAARELHSLTAQARLSATILGLLPIGFFLFLSVVARRDLQAAYETRAGMSAIVLGLALQAGAYVWIRRLLQVEP